MSPSTTDRRVFHSLDALRGFAAIAVLTIHVPDLTLSNWLSGSYLAVDLFFVLSGFVLAHSYLQRLRGSMTWAAFMRARLIRLYPLYLLGTVASIPYFFPESANPWGCMAAAFLFLPVPRGFSADIHAFPLNFPAWSLFFELAANFALALLAPRLSTRVLTLILCLGLVLLGVTSLHFGSLNVGSRFAAFWGGGGRVVYSFFAGVAIYQVWRAVRFQWLKLSMPLAVTLMLGVFLAEPAHGRAYYDLAATVVIFPLLVLAAARTEPQNVARSVAHLLGKASYAIYVLQAPLILWMSSGVLYLTHRDAKSLGLTGSVSMMGCIVLAALLFDRYYDAPVRSYLTRLASTRPPVVRGPAAPEPLTPGQP